MERHIHQKLIDFLDQNNKLSSRQHGFRSKHSCQSQLLESVHSWAKALDEGICNILRLFKGFDMVPHGKLCLKLNFIGVRGNLLNWLSAFLNQRWQHVVINGDSYKWLEVTSGVPQGSILGPLLFLIYSNDIGDSLDSESRMFADDCTIFCTVKKTNLSTQL